MWNITYTPPIYNLDMCRRLRLLTPFLKEAVFISTFTVLSNPLTPELNPSAQRCLTRFFTGDFTS
jgi:hypothetical protein